MLKVLNEFYIGKKPILPLEEQLGIIRNKFKDKHFSPSMNLDPEILKFNRMVEKTFGFYNFTLSIVPDNIPNAYAFPVGIYYSADERKKIYNAIVSNPEGFKYQDVFPGISLCMGINTGLIDLDGITNAEITGVFLHEVGHSFFEAVNDSNLSYSQYTNIIGTIRKVLDMAKDKFKYGKVVNESIIEKELSIFDKVFSNVKGFLSNIGSKFSKRSSFSESMNDNMRRSRFWYTNEKFADTFATIYGYGADVQSFLSRYDYMFYSRYYKTPKTYPSIVEKIKVFNMLADDWMNYIFGIQDEHPGDLARIKTSIEFLRRELGKEGIDPKLKREIIFQVDQLNKLIDEYINLPKDKDFSRIYRLYQIKLYEKFGGDRREQDTDNDALFANIDKRYDDLYTK